MSLYSGTTIIFVGNTHDKLQPVKESLLELGAKIISWNYDMVSPEKLRELDPSILILNVYDDYQAGVTVLNKLRADTIYKKLPTLALVEDSDSRIQAALTLGAADYFTTTELPEMVETKIRILLGHSNNFDGATVIDIPNVRTSFNKTGVRVFAVEDDSLLRNLLMTRFEQSNFAFEFSIDGKNAVEAIRNFEPQVIVLDIMLPGENGLEILEKIKADEKTSAIPVIIFSNRDEPADRKRAAELGASEFYVKALTDLSDLVETISKLA
jgi:DNA-binding response OmpR family regulator